MVEFDDSDSDNQNMVIDLRNDKKVKDKVVATDMKNILGYLN
jgi:hypothetical protein